VGIDTPVDCLLEDNMKASVPAGKPAKARRRDISSNSLSDWFARSFANSPIDASDWRKIKIPENLSEKDALAAMGHVWYGRQASTCAYSLAIGDIYTHVTTVKPRGGLAFLIKFFGTKEEAKSKYGHIRNCAHVARRWPDPETRVGKSWRELSASSSPGTDWEEERRSAHAGHGGLIHHYSGNAFGKYQKVHVFEYENARVVELEEKSGRVRALLVDCVDVETGEVLP
jgi:hypothetical protein